MMFKSQLEKYMKKKISDKDYKEATKMATDDIRVNAIGFNHKTPIKNTIKITAMCLTALQRCKS